MKKKRVFEINLKKACMSADKTKKFCKELLETQKTKTGRLKVRRQIVELLNNGNHDLYRGFSALLSCAKIIDTGSDQVEPQFKNLIGEKNDPLKKKTHKALADAQKKWG